MELILTSKRKKVRKKVEQAHYWYDSRAKKMLTGYGGKMEFVYDPEQKRSVPVVLDHEEWVDGNDYEDIKQWVKTNSDKYGIEIESDNGRNIVISIGDDQFESIREELYRHNIVSDY